MNKAINITYWITLILFSLGFLSGAYSEIVRDQSSVQLMQYLGYPLYLLTIIGIAKVLAVVGVWQKFSNTLREWAFAGIFIDLLGAVASFIAIGAGFSAILPPILFGVVIVLLYWSMKKRMGMPLFA